MVQWGHVEVMAEAAEGTAWLLHLRNSCGVLLTWIGCSATSFLFEAARP